MNNMRCAFLTHLAAPLAVGSLMIAGAASAQDISAEDRSTPSHEPSVGLPEDIIVTARRRNETIQDVPVVVAAIGAAEIGRRDLASLEGISTATPGLQIGKNETGSNQISLRGISSSITSMGIEQSTAIVIDDVYFGQGQSLNEGLFDLERIEVLKGPQALFFGKNATAGVINLKTADPTDDPEIRATAGYEFRTRRPQLSLIASGPLTDSLRGRLALRGSKMYGGISRNIATPVTYTTVDIQDPLFVPHAHDAAPGAHRAPGTKELMGRVTLEWDALDNLEVGLKGSYTYRKSNTPSANARAFFCPTGMTQLSGSACSDSFTIEQNNLPSDIAANFPLSNDDGDLFHRYRSAIVTGRAVYTDDNFVVTSVTNFTRQKTAFLTDSDWQSSDVGNWVSQAVRFRSFSSELRILTTYDGPLNLLLGGLYQNTRLNYVGYTLFAGLEDSAASTQNRYLALVRRSRTNGETLAAYGQATWKMLPEVELAAGARYTHETKKSIFLHDYVNGALQGLFRTADDASGLGVIDADQTFTNWSPDVTLSWQPTKNFLAYAAYRTAFKSGGFSNNSINSAFSTPDDFTFEGEKVKGFEVGLKSTLLDRQLTINLAGYSFLYNNLQVDFFNAVFFSFQTVTADVRAKGLEAQVNFSPRALPGLNLRSSANYGHTRYKSFPLAPCYGGQTLSEGCNINTPAGPRQDLSGRTPANAPTWTASLGASYELRTANDWNLTGSVDMRYSGSYLTSGFGNIESRQSAYATIDAGLEFTSPDERWSIGLIGKNLTNKFYVTGSVDGPSTGTTAGEPTGIHSDQFGYFNPPRTVELRLSTKF